VDLQQIKVLCVDDNPDLSLLLEKQINLQSDARSVGRVHDLEQLVPEAARVRPDVVVLDLTMLGRDALEVLPALHDSCPEARVIIYSGFDHDEAVDRARRAGAFGYVSKSAPVETLLGTIREVAAGRPGFPNDGRATSWSSAR
jgi:DNA-binding NarL/FixJ family response regulator